MCTLIQMYVGGSGNDGRVRRPGAGGRAGEARGTEGYLTAPAGGLGGGLVHPDGAFCAGLAGRGAGAVCLRVDEPGLDVSAAKGTESAGKPRDNGGGT